MVPWLFRRRKSHRRHGSTRLSAERTQAHLDDARPGSRGKGAHRPRSSRDMSYSPGRRDSLRVARRRRQLEEIPPVPTIPGPSSLGQQKASGSGETDNNRVLTTRGGESRGREEFLDDIGRIPTLHHGDSGNKRRGQPLTRSHSSKRRKENHNREAEIRAMKSLRSAADSRNKKMNMDTNLSNPNMMIGRSMTKKDSKRVRPGLSKNWERPPSHSSLPPPAESLHSDGSSDSEHVSFRVSTLSALAPRPTIRCGSNSSLPCSSPVPVRVPSQGRKLADLKEPIPEATLKAHKRIDDLANDLDAADLRELLERDGRRRQRQAENERSRLERRLKRREERQRTAAEASAEASASRGTPPPPLNLERGVLGRETPELQADRTSAIMTSSRRRSSQDSPRKREKQPMQPEQEDQEMNEMTGMTGDEDRESPLDHFHRVDSLLPDALPLESEFPPLKQEEERPEPRSGRTSPSSSARILDLIRAAKRRSKSSVQSGGENARIPSPVGPNLMSPSGEGSGLGKGSEGGKRRKWLSSFFRWGKRNRRSTGPSFSCNTSQNSMAASQVNAAFMAAKPSPCIPQRTRSRFREDLPELPTPPDSRVSTPDRERDSRKPLPVITDDVAMRYDTPTSGHRVTPISMHRDEIQSSPAPMSMSLASIDSEASWLSGGRLNGKRTSSNMQSSLTHYPLHVEEPEADDDDVADDDVADDDFLQNVMDDKHHRHSLGDPQPSSDDEEDGCQSPKWGTINKTPRVVQAYSRRSAAGVLQSFDQDDEQQPDIDTEMEPRSSDAEESPTFHQRSTSIKFGKERARSHSAGSASLLGLGTPSPAEKHLSSGSVSR